MGARMDLEKGNENLYRNVKRIREFYITDHAYLRIRKRVKNYHKHQLHSHIIDSWEKGKKTPKGFDRRKAHRPTYYDGFKYKYYIGYIWIWGTKKRDGYTEKHLITVYNWHNGDDQRTYMGRANLGGKPRRNAKYKTRKYDR